MGNSHKMKKFNKRNYKYKLINIQQFYLETLEKSNVLLLWR